MQIKFTCWHFLIMMIYSYGLPTWAASDALFSNASNKLTIPYASFQGHSYQATLLFEAPDTLTLETLTSEYRYRSR